MGVFYPCWSTGHSDKTAKIFQSPPIPFAVTFNGKVYASEGKNQYWDWEQYDYFNGCSSLEDFKNRIEKLKAEKVFGEDVFGANDYAVITTEQPDKSEKDAGAAAKKVEAGTEAETGVCLSLF